MRPMNKTITIIIVVVLVIIGAVWLITSNGATQSVQSPTGSAEVSKPKVLSEAAKAAIARDATLPMKIGITGNEFSYEPNIMMANVGQNVTVVYKNTGKYPHNFVIDELGVKSQTIKAGETATFSFTPSKAGSFAFYCSLPNHREKGMIGTVYVR